jgi:WD40 repeat protein
MKRAALFLIGWFFAQFSAWAQPACPAYNRLIKAGIVFMQEKKYQNALNKFNAAKLCLPDSSLRVDKRIGAVFAAINRDKDEAIWQRLLAMRQKRLAEIAKVAAQKATLRAQALYWANESDKLPRFQAIRLLEQAANCCPEGLPTPVYERLFRRFNEDDSLWQIPFSFLKPFEGFQYARFSSKGNQILTKYIDTVRVWDLKGNLLNTPFGEGDFFGISSVELSPRGDRILTIASRAANTPYWKEANSVKIWDLKGKPRVIDTLTNNYVIIKASFSPDGNRVLTVSTNYELGTVKIWNLNGKLLDTLTHEKGVENAVFSPDGKQILTSSGGAAKIWDQKGKLLATITRKPTNNLVTFVPSPDWTRILTISDSMATIVDLKNRPLATLAHTDQVDIASFSYDGKRILTSSGETAKIWDQKGKLLAVLIHAPYITSAVFSPDGTRILTGSIGETVKIWDQKGNLLGTTPSHGLNFEYAVFSPNGNRIIAYTRSGTYVWSTVESALKWLKETNHKLPPLSEENKKKYGLFN